MGCLRLGPTGTYSCLSATLHTVAGCGSSSAGLSTALFEGVGFPVGFKHFGSFFLSSCSTFSGCCLAARGSHFESTLVDLGSTSVGLGSVLSVSFTFLSLRTMHGFAGCDSSVVGLLTSTDS